MNNEELKMKNEGSQLNKLRVAIVADWLTSRGGAERVILLLAEMFPQADIYTSVFKAKNFPELADRRVMTSALQNSPLRYKQQLFPTLRPQVFENFNLDDYDLVLSSAHAEAKGVLTKPETLHICYCHTPTRYYWSHYHEYLQAPQLGLLSPLIKAVMPRLVHRLRLWDRVAADRVDLFIANSHNTARRIKKYYERDSHVIYPPVDYERFQGDGGSGDYYLIVGRQIEYKHSDIAVMAFNELGLPLKIIGEGPELPRLKRLIKSDKIELLGRLTDEQTTRYFQNCKALLFPQEEDFGIVPLEAMAAGKPVIAYRAGGALETVVDGQTGLFFDEQTSASLCSAVRRFEQMTFSPEVAKAHARKFDNGEFKHQMREFIQTAWQQYQDKLLMGTPKWSNEVNILGRGEIPEPQKERSNRDFPLK